MAKVLDNNSIRFRGFGGKITSPKDSTQNIHFNYTEDGVVKVGSSTVNLVKGDTPAQSKSKAVIAANDFLAL